MLILNNVVKTVKQHEALQAKVNHDVAVEAHNTVNGKAFIHIDLYMFNAFLTCVSGKNCMILLRCWSWSNQMRICSGGLKHVGAPLKSYGANLNELFAITASLTEQHRNNQTMPLTEN